MKSDTTAVEINLQQKNHWRNFILEFIRKLRTKEFQIRMERQLRDQQLAKILKALLFFEARLIQEQKIILQQLREKDDIIRQQYQQIRKLQSGNGCLCEDVIANDLDTNSEFCSDKCQCSHQSGICSLNSNYESLGSSSEIYDTTSEKDCVLNSHEASKQGCKSNIKYTENQQKYSIYYDLKRARKYSISKSKETYYEPLKQSENCNSNDEENKQNEIDSLLKEIGNVSERIEHIFSENETTLNKSIKFSKKINTLRDSLSKTPNRVETSKSVNAVCDAKPCLNIKPDETHSNSELSNKIPNIDDNADNVDSDRISLELYELNSDIFEDNQVNSGSDNSSEKLSLNLESTINGNKKMKTRNKKLFKINNNNNLFLFDKNDSDCNDNWYINASDPEDDWQPDVYRNNPVLECMNQILLQSKEDTPTSPPKSPCLEENVREIYIHSSPTNVNNKHSEKNNSSGSCLESNYYETPIPCITNIYEIPQSVYSNNYEQILTDVNEFRPDMNIYNITGLKKGSIEEKDLKRTASQKNNVRNINLQNIYEQNGYYYVDMEKEAITNPKEHTVSKKLRMPPELPPKPKNLVSKFKVRKIPTKEFSKTPENIVIDSEPDYCSISEINLAAESNKMKNISNDIKHASDASSLYYDQIIGNGSFRGVAEKANKDLNKISVSQLITLKEQKLIRKETPEIPKLPQVSEIIIPTESDSEHKNGQFFPNKNIKNTVQLSKQKSLKNRGKIKRSIQVAASVSNLITGSNNRQIFSEINSHKHLSSKIRSPSRVLPNFYSVQNIEIRTRFPGNSSNLKAKTDPLPSCEKFDLSHNFEEFKLDDCEIKNVV